MTIYISKVTLMSNDTLRFLHTRLDHGSWLNKRKAVAKLMQMVRYLDWLICSDTGNLKRNTLIQIYWGFELLLRSPSKHTSDIDSKFHQKTFRQYRDSNPRSLGVKHEQHHVCYLPVLPCSPTKTIIRVLVLTLMSVGLPYVQPKGTAPKKLFRDCKNALLLRGFFPNTQICQIGHEVICCLCVKNGASE